jgi:hypothetical protein
MSSTAIALTTEISAIGIATVWTVHALVLAVAGLTAIFSPNPERREAAIRIARLMRGRRRK